MTSIRKLVSALCWATCFLSFSLSAQQIDSTGNLINNNNWSGAVYGADPGGCCASISGSGALYDTTTDTIMFSYGTSTLSQTIAINQALGGTGIQVHGYNYGWDFRYISNNTTKNDSLSFNISLRDSSGIVVESQTLSWDNAMQMGIFNYDTWYTVSNSRTFNNPYLDPQSITLSMTGRDGGFWAGYYGPEVRNVSLSLNYSFDPCANDPLYSSSCPGYFQAYMSNLFAMLGWGSSPEPEIEVASVNYSLAPTTSSTTPEESTTGEVKVDAGGIEVSTSGELAVPDGIPEEVKEKKSIDKNLLSNILREATDDSKALSVVNQSIQNSMSDDANPDFSMVNETLASIARQRDNSIEQATLESQEASQMSNSSSNSFGSSLDENNGSNELQTDGNTQEAEIKNITPVQVVTEDTKETNTTTKKNVQDNEAAGEVSIDALAQAPIDFNEYLNQQMKDMAFYLPKEIYKGQKNVDNARLLRGLTGGSDKLHQEMVEQQYR